MGAVCRGCISKMKYSPVVSYLIERGKNRLDLKGPAWTVDQGFLDAAISEGCDPPLCHACERPLRIGEAIGIAMVGSPDGDPRNANVAAIAHYACSGRTVQNMTDWRKKHG